LGPVPRCSHPFIHHSCCTHFFITTPPSAQSPNANRLPLPTSTLRRCLRRWLEQRKCKRSERAEQRAHEGEAAGAGEKSERESGCKREMHSKRRQQRDPSCALLFN